jgi:hypothetical protein
MASVDATPPITERCYCGAISVRATQAPQIVCLCHCVDCRRVSGAPMVAVAAFDASAVTFEPDDGRTVSLVPGAVRNFCGKCGSPLSFRGDYVPDQIYVPIGLLDQAGELAPQVHSYESQRLPWLHIDDDIQRFENSAQTRLVEAAKKRALS